MHFEVARIAASDVRLRPLIAAQLALSAAAGPKDSDHALDAAGLEAKDIRIWGLFDGADLLACGALKALPGCLLEVKSVHVRDSARRRGAGRALMRHLIEVARQEKARALVLETGSLDVMAPARALYASLGFEFCGPFHGYSEDPHSAFMRLSLDPAAYSAQEHP